MAQGSTSPSLRPRQRRQGSCFFWFLTGGLLGALGVAVTWMMDGRGGFPGGAATTATAGLAQTQTQVQPPPKPRYDYPTILPDLEVVVPEEDMSNRPPALPPPPGALEAAQDTAKGTAKETGKAAGKETSKTAPKETVKAPAKETTKAPAKETAKAPAKEPAKGADKAAASAKEADAPASADGETYILQVASLATPAEAEQFKAKLAQQGISASIQQATVDGKTRYRIRTGPLKGKEAANKVRAQLASRGHQAITIKLK
jgi:cell division protein FtsN